MNWSLKVHTWYTHTIHMPNVQWMPYSFVRLYLFKCDVCVLNYIWIKLKRFLIILSVFESDFLSFFVFMFCAYFVFYCFKHVLCWKIGVRVFHDSLMTHLVTCQSQNSQVASSSRSFHNSLATSENFRDLSRDLPVMKSPETTF